MANLGLDFAGSPPSPAAIKAAGYTFVMRYLSRYTAKVITKGEYEADTAAGIGVGLVFEDYANQALKGYAQGVSDAQFALGQARGIGWPEDRPIYFAVDFDINDAQKPAAAEYMKGVASILGLGRVGAYGGYWWIKYCFDNNLATFGWQAVAWSGGNRDPRAHLFQRLGGVNVGGTACDVNEALKDDFGQNNAGGINDMSTIGDYEARILIKHIYGYTNELDIESAIPALVGGESNTVIRRMDATPTADAYQKQIADWQKAANTPAPTPTPPPTPPSNGGLTPDQDAKLTGIAAAVQWIKDKLSAIFK